MSQTRQDDKHQPRDKNKEILLQVLRLLDPTKHGQGDFTQIYNEVMKTLDKSDTSALDYSTLDQISRYFGQLLANLPQTHSLRAELVARTDSINSLLSAGFMHSSSVTSLATHLLPKASAPMAMPTTLLTNFNLPTPTGPSTPLATHLLPKASAPMAMPTTLLTNFNLDTNSTVMNANPLEMDTTPVPLTTERKSTTTTTQESPTVEGYQPTAWAMMELHIAEFERNRNHTIHLRPNTLKPAEFEIMLNQNIQFRLNILKLIDEKLFDYNNKPLREDQLDELLIAEDKLLVDITKLGPLEQKEIYTLAKKIFELRMGSSMKDHLIKVFHKESYYPTRDQKDPAFDMQLNLLGFERQCVLNLYSKGGFGLYYITQVEEYFSKYSPNSLNPEELLDAENTLLKRGKMVHPSEQQRIFTLADKIHELRVGHKYIERLTTAGQQEAAQGAYTKSISFYLRALQLSAERNVAYDKTRDTFITNVTSLYKSSDAAGKSAVAKILQDYAEKETCPAQIKKLIETFAKVFNTPENNTISNDSTTATLVAGDRNTFFAYTEQQTARETSIAGDRNALLVNRQPEKELEGITRGLPPITPKLYNRPQ
jgi:hypothetical protein